MHDEIATLTRVYGLIVDFFVRYAFQLLGAVLIMGAGAWVAAAVGRAVLRMQARRNVDVTLRQFIASTVRLVVLVIFAVIALAKLGISIAPLVAAIGGAALGAGMALQGTVSNYGAGLSLILGRPFKVGDTIEVQQCAGVVTEIGLGATRLKAEDGEIIVIPNRQIVGEIHRNSFGRRVAEGTVGVAYHHDPLRAVTLVSDALHTLADVAETPAPQVGIDSFGETAIAIAYRYWVPSDRYFEVRHTANAAVYRALVDGGVDILPQREVHLVRGQV